MPPANRDHDHREEGADKEARDLEEICASLRVGTLKDAKVAKELTEFVLVRLEPLDWEEDAILGKRFGIEKYPALLLLDWRGEKKLGEAGDVSIEKVVEVLEGALDR